MARQASVRAKNGHWYSEAGGVGRYFGRVDRVSRAEAMARMWAALADAGGGGDSSGRGFTPAPSANGSASSANELTNSGSASASASRRANELTNSGSGSASLLVSSLVRNAHANDAEGVGSKTHSQLSTLTVAELRDRFLGWLRCHRSRRTHGEREKHLRRFAKVHGERDAGAIAAGDLESFLGSIASRDWRHKHEVSIRAMYRWGVRHGHLPRDLAPFATVEPTRAPVKVLYESDLPTPEEVRALIAHATPTLADLLIVQHATGARTGELRGARVGDYQPTIRQVVLRHHKREATMREPRPRVIVLNADADAVVKRLCEGRPHDAPMFTTPTGKAWSDTLSSWHWIKARDAAGVRETLTPYALRHLWISEALMAGVDVLLVAKLAGTSVAMIERVYGRFRAASLADAQARLDAARQRTAPPGA